MEKFPPGKIPTPKVAEMEKFAHFFKEHFIFISNILCTFGIVNVLEIKAKGVARALEYTIAIYLPYRTNCS